MLQVLSSVTIHERVTFKEMDIGLKHDPKQIPSLGREKAIDYSLVVVLCTRRLNFRMTLGKVCKTAEPEPA